MRTDTLNFDLAGFVYDWDTSKPGTKQYWMPETRSSFHPAFPLPPVSRDFFEEMDLYLRSHYASLSML